MTSGMVSAKTELTWPHSSSWVIPESIRLTALPKDSLSYSDHTWQVDFFGCCFHFYHLCYKSVINRLSFTHVRGWEKSPNYLLSPSVKEQGATNLLSTPFSSFFLYVWDLPSPVSCELEESFSNYQDFSQTNFESLVFFFSLKLGKYSFETMFHFQLALRKIWISA